ncbi:zinc finger protein OZF-like isoform X1 [Corythoichthys intestinalis]|uniref:zinc finger protein OZF-like isoform X1 n=1 Tax=Corythoichthys intestinalis TaxID=161448 RepID=UPI0025A68C60|nr:zinc finger protein OZF-like isoform X1 [Corythoichthys intestinalis]
MSRDIKKEDDEWQRRGAAKLEMAREKSYIQRETIKFGMSKSAPVQAGDTETRGRNGSRMALRSSLRYGVIGTAQLATKGDINASIWNLASSSPDTSIASSAGDALPDQASPSSSADLVDARCPKWQESSHVKKEEVLYIKEEKQENIIKVPHPHVKEQSPLCIKEEQESPGIKDEEEDLTSLKSEGEESRAGEQPNSSSSTERDGEHRGRSPIDQLIAPLSDIDHATSHSSDYDDEEESDGQKMGRSNQHWKCTQCGNTYRYWSLFKRHMVKHTGEKPFSCSVCGRRFSHKANLERHDRTHTGEKPFPCSVCSQRFSEKGTLIKHTRIHTGEKPFACSVCGQRFSRRGTLKVHTRTHTGEKPFLCSICGQRFSERGSLGRHARTQHTGEKPFSCSVCGKSFFQKVHLESHTIAHNGEKPFSCSICGKSFIEKGNLKNHTRTHTGEKPFSCAVCGQTFSAKGTLNRHKKTHTGEKPFLCSVCGQRFSLKGNLKRHAKRRHC